MSRLLADEARSRSDVGPAREDRPAGRLERLLTLSLWVAIVGFAVVGIGTPLIGIDVFAPSDIMARWAPYNESVMLGVSPRNTYLQDVADGVIPQTALYIDLLWEGEYASWNPYMLGGTPLAALPNNAFLSPVSLPFYILPLWLAPAYVKLLEITISVGGAFLWARRLGLSRAASAIAGLGFATSAFMIMWTGWPHTRTAAFIPVLFWALERLVQRRRVSDGVLVCLTIAAMFFGGFPAVTGYAVFAGALYLLVRLFAEYPGQWRRIIGLVVGAGSALVGAVTLAAFQLLPFASFMSNAYVYGREQTPGDHIPPRALITLIAPWALGTTDPLREPLWWMPVNLVESMSYLGAASLLLALIALAMPRAAWGVLPRGVWSFLVAALGVGFLVLYIGGPPLALLQQLPFLFSDNFVGRARSVYGLFLALMVAIGFEILLRRYRERREQQQAPAAPARWERWWARTVWIGAGIVIPGLWFAAHQMAANSNPNGAERAANVDRQVLIGLAFLTVAGIILALAWGLVRRVETRWRTLRGLALVIIPILITVQALTLVVPYWVRPDRETFYPQTQVHEFLAAHLGAERYASGGDALMVGESSYHQLRSLNGHAFLNARMGELIEGLPGTQFRDPPTYLVVEATEETVTNPILDRLAVRYYLASPTVPVLGEHHPADTDGSTVTLEPGTSVTVPVPVTGPLRAIGLILTGPVTQNTLGNPVDTRIEVSLRDASGEEVAHAERVVRGLPEDEGGEFQLPLAAEEVPEGTELTAVITAHTDAPIEVAAVDGLPALSVVTPADDGLRLLMGTPTVIYERATALPRIRWASEAVVEADPDRRLEMLADGEIGPDQVLLEETGAVEADGGQATVEVLQDGTDTIEVAVDAGGAGYLVVADALQHDWRVTVDGVEAELLPADHGLVAVAVPDGEHIVRFSYVTPYHGAGSWLSAVTALLLCALVAGEWWWFRRRHITPR